MTMRAASRRAPLCLLTQAASCSLHAQTARQRICLMAGRALGQVAAGTSTLIASVDAVCAKMRGLFAAWPTADASDALYNVAVEGACSRASLCLA